MTKNYLLISFLFFAEAAGAQTTYWPQTWWHSLKTNEALLAKKYDEALIQSENALEKDPLKPELQINLGNSFDGLGALSKAREAYGAAESLTSDPAVQFQARYNQAQALGKEKKVPEALAMYQKALELDPTSKEVKTNIELLLSGKGGQGGDGDQNNDQQDQQGKDNKDPKKGPQKFAENPKQEKKQPANLSAGDVKKILEEIKQQEQRIRGDYYKQGQRDQKQKFEDGKREKDW